SISGRFLDGALVARSRVGRWIMRNVRFAWPGCALFVATTTASAQPRVNAVSDSNGAGFDTHLFRPALDSRGLIAVNGVDVMPANRLSLGLVLDYGKNLLHAPGGGVLVSDSLTGTVHVEYGIANRAAVGVSAPLVVMSGDATSAVPGWGPQP